MMTESDVGVVIINTYKHAAHIATRVKKVNKMLGMIQRSHIRIRKYYFLCIRVNLVRSHLGYAVHPGHYIN